MPLGLIETIKDPIGTISKGASTPSNIASNIAGKCVADPSTLSKFQGTRSKITGNTQASTPSNIAGNVASNIARNIAGNVEHVQLSSILLAIFSYLEGEIDYNLAKRILRYCAQIVLGYV